MRNAISGEIFPLGDVSLIGRGDSATIRLADASVSRQHASVRYQDANFWVVDLGSANGTFVNGSALGAPRVLRGGDRLQFGKVVLVFEDEGSATARTEVLDERTQISRLPPQPIRSAPMTILVGDLKGFTAICTLLSAQEVAGLLREWYADCEAILKRHGASIDKFIGDCVFAYWHGTEPDIRDSAIRAAEALRAAEAVPSSPMRALLRGRHGIALDCRLGLHLGDVAVGSMGKGINTALGDAVNLAFRIEGLTRTADEPILVSAAFVDGFSRRTFRSCGRYEVKGVEEPVEVFGMGD
ncbi:adenylate/guanylate cyclase domain-containing protein [Mesorhizobium sp. LHD-90]|uniref:adenylate/guanylate cyclase domain-containing protein n=1 Tax=Mesorhizobium sp. LHD-90 TaxID=3071414 RepID=UPI0027E03DE6|nr:adenylate/guanylate cyclase domain-containing protein [Mesorhizobium sp. LHD-90]MDQ6433980.1 adenylate/guanylate cyclase domain-containing protein [Mesorhizobium sp. LHD-90]